MKDLPSSRNNYLESLDLFKENSEKRGLAYCFEGLAMVAVSMQGYEVAATPFTFAEKLRKQIGAPLSAAEQTEFDSAVALMRKKLAPIAFPLPPLKAAP